MPVYPISFSIHASKIVTEVPEKKQLLANIIPGKSYTYDSEEEYYKEYQQSWFGITTKKAGWDCMRHYEILANGCIPLFEDLSSLPERTMTTFPVDILEEAKAIYHILELNPTLLEEENTLETLKSFVENLLDYTRTYLTTESVARYILNSSGHSEAKRVLYISQQLFPDYLRCVTLLGFKDIFGSLAHDYIKVSHLYKDDPRPRELYGRGFSYSRILKSESRNDSYDLTLLEDIRNRNYDIIIFGSCYRGLPLHTFIRLFYEPENLIYLCGEDEQTRNPHSDLQLSEKSHVYIRELV